MLLYRTHLAAAPSSQPSNSSDNPQHVETHIGGSDPVKTRNNLALEQINRARRNLRSIDAAPNRRHLAAAPSSQPSNSSDNPQHVETHIGGSDPVKTRNNLALEQINRARRNLRSIDAAPYRTHLAAAPSSQPSNSSDNPQHVETHICGSDRVEVRNNPSPKQSSSATTQTTHVATPPMRRHLETETESSNPSAHCGNTAVKGNALTRNSVIRRGLRRRPTQLSLDRPTEPINSLDNLETGPNVNSEPENWPSTLTAEQEERCYDPNDTTFTFVDGEDDMDFELEDYKSLRAKMSCGHTVTPTSLIKWCRRQLDKGEVEFVCGQPGCDAVWSCDEVCKMALLTPAETKDIENTLFDRAKDYFGAKKCPGCKSLVLREDQSNLRVCCTVCTRNKRKIYQFCWQCLKEWTLPSPHADHCADPDCVCRPQEILRKCSEITFKDVRLVTGCPSVRACPTCGLLIEHNKIKCKNIICSRCKVQFCFVCLKLSAVCGSYFTACIGGVAPRQTSIPVWKGK